MPASLPDFYQTYGCDDALFQALFIAYEKSINALVEYIDQIVRNRIISKMETYRIVPQQDIKIKDATYNLNSLLSNEDICRKIGLAGLTLSAKLSAWEQLAISQKMIALFAYGSYIILFANPVTADDTDDTKNPVMFSKSDIVNIDLYSDSGELLSRGVDYEIKDNQLYLFDSHSSTANANKIYIAKNINIDFDYVNSVLGTPFNLSHSEYMSKNDLNELVQILSQKALNGPKLNAMKSAVQAIVSKYGDDANIYDIQSDCGQTIRNMYKNLELTPFDFVVQIPAEFNSSEYRTSILQQYLNLVKDTGTNFITMLISSYTELYNFYVKSKDIYNLDTIQDLLNTDIWNDDTDDASETTVLNVYRSFPVLNIITYSLNTNFKLNNVERVPDGERDVKEVLPY